MTTFAIALLIGLAFGAILQRSGLARPDVMLDALRLRDLTLVKFIALAVGIAAIGIGALSSLGLAHLSVKPLYLLGVAGGGLLFGAGFALAGYCPGTSIVASMEGRRDAWFSLFGAFAGALAYAVAYPALAPRLVEPLAFGSLTLSGAAGVGAGTAGAVVGAAFIAIALALPSRPRAQRARSAAPAFAAPAQAPEKREPSALEKALLGVRLVEAHRLLPGLGLAAAVMLAANALGGVLGAWLLRAQGIDPTGKASPISGIMVAIILGVIVANTVGTARVFAPGLEFSIKKMLRLGIILVGIKLSLMDVVRLGAWGVPVVIGIVTAALILTTWFARRLSLTDRLGSLAAASTAICGVTATMAVAPSIDAKDDEVAYTVANVTLFGILAMFVYPYLAHALFAEKPGAAGLFLGTAIHETSQVMGAALSYKEVFHDELVLKIATITKLTRNVLLVAVVPVLAYWSSRRSGGAGAKLSFGKLFPVFVLGFLGLAVLRSIGDAGLAGGGSAFGTWDAKSWTLLTKKIGEGFATYALGTAMAGVGLTTSLKVFKGLGLRPLYVGAAAAAVVGALGLALAALVGPYIGS